MPAKDGWPSICCARKPLAVDGSKPLFQRPASSQGEGLLRDHPLRFTLIPSPKPISILKQTFFKPRYIDYSFERPLSTAESTIPPKKTKRARRPTLRWSDNRGADLRRGGGESEAFTAASESGRAPCCGAHSATEQGARRSRHRDCARQGRAQHGGNLRPKGVRFTDWLAKSSAWNPILRVNCSNAHSEVIGLNRTGFPHPV